MRTLARIQVLAALAFGTIIFVIYYSSSDHIVKTIQNTFSSRNKRLVVFGDYHSDIGIYRFEDSGTKTKPPRDKDQGLRWTALLQKELGCDRIDNFARSYTTERESIPAAALVDHAVLANFTQNETLAVEPNGLADFKTQVQQWLEYERRRGEDSVKANQKERTVFSVFFGFWDIWEMSKIRHHDPVYAVEEVVYALFDQLDIIAANTPRPPTIILFTTFDMTFTPRYQNERVEHPFESQLVDEQRNSISLVEEWNKALQDEARMWPNGNLILFDMNKWLVDQLRQRQLYDFHYWDQESIGGEKTPMFDEVVTPCLTPTKITLDRGRCKNPKQHLFWDDLQFGPTAHELIAKEVAKLVKTNETYNNYASNKMFANAAVIKDPLYGG